MEKNIFDFLQEDRIIERTQNCNLYFDKLISSRDLFNSDNEVSFYFYYYFF